MCMSFVSNKKKCQGYVLKKKRNDPLSFKNNFGNKTNKLTLN